MEVLFIVSFSFSWQVYSVRLIYLYRALITVW